MVTLLPSGPVIVDSAWIILQTGLSTQLLLLPCIPNSLGPFPQVAPSSSSSKYTIPLTPRYITTFPVRSCEQNGKKTALAACKSFSCRNELGEVAASEFFLALNNE